MLSSSCGPLGIQRQKMDTWLSATQVAPLIVLTSRQNVVLKLYFNSPPDVYGAHARKHRIYKELHP